MSIKQLRRQKGFTLIEVIIVLAIAALIILVVLQAVAGAQKSQRDNTRKQESSRISSYLTQWSSNNNGKYPPSTDTLSTDLSSYDATLIGKYTLNNVTTAPTVGALCGTGSGNSVQPSDYIIDYMVNSSGYDYKLWVCQEAGGWSVVKS